PTPHEDRHPRCRREVLAGEGDETVAGRAVEQRRGHRLRALRALRGIERILEGIAQLILAPAEIGLDIASVENARRRERTDDAALRFVREQRRLREGDLFRASIAMHDEPEV